MSITFQKRQKEMKRLEKQRAKAEKRAQKKAAKTAAKEGDPSFPAGDAVSTLTQPQSQEDIERGEQQGTPTAQSSS